MREETISSAEEGTIWALGETKDPGFFGLGEVIRSLS